MCFTKSFKEYLKLYEATATIKDIFPNLKDKEIPPILLTFNEYYEKINGTSKSHPSDAYTWKYDKEYKFKCPSDSQCKIIKQKKVGKLDLVFYEIKTKNQFAKWDGDKYLGVYSDDEMTERGMPMYSYDYSCVLDGVVVGNAQDEWGCVLITVADEFSGLGIGEELVKMYREKYLYKPSGGFTPSGYRQFRKYYNHLVSTALRNGIYSEMVRKGEIGIVNL